MALFLRTLGLNWGLPNAHHVTSYNCDEYTLLTSLQALNPAKLKFNPVSEKDPMALATGTFHLYTYAAALKTLSFTGWIKIVPDKNFYYDHPAEWGRFFLAGRLMSVVYGLLTVWLIYLLAGGMYGHTAALLAAFFTAVAPALVMHSRYMTTNMPGLFWVVLAFYFLKELMDGGRTKHYLLAGMAAGFAMATRYSAAPLLPMMCVAHYLAPGKGGHRKLAAGIAAAALFFLLGEPYALLDYKDFLNGLMAVKGTAAGGAAAGFLPGLRAFFAQLYEALGPLFILFSAGGIAAALLRRRKDDVLLLFWVLPLLLIFARAGGAATGGRMLPALPFMLLLGAAAIAPLVRARNSHAALAASVAAVYALYYLACFRLILAPDLRDEASLWMEAGLKPGTSVGLLREPSWFSPGAIDRKYRHPDHALLPGVSFVPLNSGDMKSTIGLDLLGRARPGVVALTDTEVTFLGGKDPGPAIEAAGYVPVKEFRAGFAAAGMPLQRRLPEMLYIPNWIRFYERKDLCAEYSAG
jgi:hypothetical protein